VDQPSQLPGAPLTGRLDFSPRFEVLPFGRSVEEAATLPEPTRLTVTCSPKHGPDHSLETAQRLRALGHRVTLHVAARMVRDAAHLGDLLSRLEHVGVDDVLLVGGDGAAPQGRYASADELLPLIAEHPRRPRAIGIAGYPEGHPLIDDAALSQALVRKAGMADYITTQMCFDPGALLGWITAIRADGVTPPVLVGVPGVVNPRKLLEISMRIGVGPSLAFMRKQRLGNLLATPRRSRTPGDRVHEQLAPQIGDPELGIAGFHYFTFNELVATWRWRARSNTNDQLAGGIS
jgi:methylenetetrahydrofolate reductase (NADPH)